MFTWVVCSSKELETNVKGAYEMGRWSKKALGLGGLTFRKGDHIGHFSLGSTVVLVFRAPKNFSFLVTPGQTVKYGQSLGHISQQKVGVKFWQSCPIYIWNIINITLGVCTLYMFWYACQPVSFTLPCTLYICSDMPVSLYPSLSPVINDIMFSTNVSLWRSSICSM